METEYEDLYTISDYHDGPRSGVALFQGRLHFFQAIFDQTIDEWSDLFLLKPIDEQTYQLVLEEWAIWKRWERAYATGRSKMAAFPALPADRERYGELQAILFERLQIDPAAAVQAKARFLPANATGAAQVSWTPLGAPDRRAVVYEVWGAPPRHGYSIVSAQPSEELG